MLARYIYAYQKSEVRAKKSKIKFYIKCKNFIPSRSSRYHRHFHSEPPPPPKKKKKVLNFNMIFNDSTKMFFFQNIKYKAEFKNLDDFEVLSSDFPDLRTSVASVTSMTFTASFHVEFLWNVS